MKSNASIRAVFSIALVAVGAIVYLHDPEAPFVITETAPVVQPPKPAPSPDVGADEPPIPPTICTFHCAHCRRAPTLQYDPNAVLPAYAVCKQCTARCPVCRGIMPRTDPPLNAIEKRVLGIPLSSAPRQAPRPIQSCQT